MRRGTTIVSSLAMSVTLTGAASVDVPSEVAAFTHEMNKTCKQAGGKQSPSGIFDADSGKFHPMPLVEPGVIDGTEFWAIDASRFRCAGAVSLFSGSGGAQVDVFARLSDGTVKNVFSQGAYGMKVTQSGLSLGVAGTLCGQKEPTSHADAVGCDRPIVWDRSAQKMSLAPVPKAPSATPSASAQASVPVMEEAGNGETANCFSAKVSGLKAGGDGFLAVRAGPGTQYRKVAELHNDEIVLVYGGRGKCSGIVYRTENATCHSLTARVLPYTNQGWVDRRWLTHYAG